MQQPSTDLIEDSAIEKGINLEVATIEDLFIVYTDVFLTIEEMLQIDPEYFPESSIELIKQALNRMLQKFEALKRQSLKKKTYNEIMLVLSHLRPAVGAITQASIIIHSTTSDQLLYFKASGLYAEALLNCRDHIGDINSQLKSG